MNGSDREVTVHAGWEATGTPALVVLDFDGTLVDQRGGWLLLQELFGTRDRGEVLSERYRAGELTFAEWCTANVDAWADRGVTASHVERAAKAVKFTRGATSLLRRIRDAELPFGVVSAGVANLQRRLEGFDPAFVASNEIRFTDDGSIAGVDATVGPDAKDEVLAEICERRGISTDDVFYVGDSHSDEQAFAVVGRSVLFDPDDRIDDGVVEEVDAIVYDRDLRHVERLLVRLFDDSAVCRDLEP